MQIYVIAYKYMSFASTCMSFATVLHINICHLQIHAMAYTCLRSFRSNATQTKGLAVGFIGVRSSLYTGGRL